MAPFRLRRRISTIPEMPIKHHSIVTWEKGHVRASVVELGKGAAELMGVAAAPVHGISRTSHPDVDRWFAGCDRALTQAEDMTPNSCGHKIVPDYVTMSIPAEITRTLSVVVSHLRRHADQSITFAELSILLRRGYRRAQDIHGTRGRNVAEDIIHGSLAQITLDGQAVVDPLGLRGKQLELRMSFYLAPLEWIRTLEIIAERLELGLIAMVPHHVAYASPLAGAAVLLVLLDEHHTVINMVRHGCLEWATLAEMGERHLIGMTARALNLEGRQADALMRVYRGGQLHPDVELELVRIFWGTLRKWMTVLADQVKTVTHNATIPHQITFLDLTRRIPEALPSLETPFWESSLPFDSCPEVTEFGVNTVRNVLDCTTQAGGTHYLLLRALAHHVARVYAPGGSLDRALMRTIR